MLKPFHTAAMLTLLLVLMHGCDADTDARGSAAGVAVLSLEGAPAEVACLRISIDGAYHVERLLALAEMDDDTFLLRALPVGTNRFTGFGYAEACGSIEQGSGPTWTSAPVEAILLPGIPAEVHLILRRNGSANITVEFESDALDAGPFYPDAGGIDAEAAVPDAHTATDATSGDAHEGEAACPTADAASQPEPTRPVLTVDGAILDFDGTRALTVSASRMSASIVSAQAAPVVIYEGSSPVSSGELFPGGALLSAGTYWLWNGTLEPLSATNAVTEGRWLAYIREEPYELSGTPFTQSFVVLRDLSTGTEPWTWSTPRATLRYSVGRLDVASDGDVVWSSSSGTHTELYWRDDQTIRAVPLIAGNYPVYVRTDGVNTAVVDVLTSRQPPATLHTSTGSERLCDAPQAPCPFPQLAAGWTAYGAPEPMTSCPIRRFQVYRRSPSGEHAKLTHFGSSTKPVAVGANGEVVAENSRQYLLRDGHLPFDIGPAGQRTIYRDGWYILQGSSVLEVVPPAHDDPCDTFDWGVSDDPCVIGFGILGSE